MDLIDYQLSSRQNETFGTRLIGEGGTPFSVKRGNEGLAKILEKRGFEVIGFKPEHGGRVYLREGNKDGS